MLSEDLQIDNRVAMSSERLSRRQIMLQVAQATAGCAPDTPHGTAE